MKKKTVCLMFLDVSGFSKLLEPQLRIFLESVLPKVAGLIQPMRSELIELNTWGDAIVAAASDPYTLARLALDVRDFYRNENWAEHGLPNDLSARIALHAGVVYTGSDPIRGTDGIIGSQVNLAARIEPITTPGEVWVTEQFMKLVDPSVDSKLSFDELGERPLAKKFGSTLLWRLRRNHEAQSMPSDTKIERSEEPAVARELAITIHMARHGTAAQQIAALDLLDQFNVPESVTALIDVARDKGAPHRARRMALASLGQLQARSSVPDLIDIVNDRDEFSDIVGTAMDALGSIRDIRGVPAIANALLGDRSLESEAIREGVLALAKIGDRKSVAFIREMFEKRERFGSIPVLEALIVASMSMPDSSLRDPLQAIARDTSYPATPTRGAAFEALMSISAHQSEALFIETAMDVDENLRVRRAALQGLALCTSARSRELLYQIASDLSHPLAEVALVVITKGEQLAKEAIQKVRQSL